MKVLFTKRNYAPMGGSESLTYQWATRLAARGHDVRVVCGQAFDARPRFEDHGVDVIQVKPRGGFLGQVVDASTMLDMMRIEELERHAEDRDLIHNVGREYLDSSLNVAQELDMPIVLTPLAHPGQFHGGDTQVDFMRYRRATVITTGMGANAVRSHDGAAFRARHRIPADAPLVLYVGRRERYKGYIHLLDAAELVWQRYNEARFVFIGVPGFYGAMVDEFARYTDERIIEIERAGAEEKSAALDACDLYAMPSAHETFGIGYLEAWLHEKPVIGGDIPPLREVIANGVDGLLVPQKVADIARAVTSLLDAPELRREMGRAGNAKLRERWDWDRVMDRVEDAHQRAIGAHLPADEALA